MVLLLRWRRWVRDFSCIAKRLGADDVGELQESSGMGEPVRLRAGWIPAAGVTRCKLRRRSFIDTSRPIFCH
jgi:hypothetical protein